MATLLICGGSFVDLQSAAAAPRASISSAHARVSPAASSAAADAYSVQAESSARSPVSGAAVGFSAEDLVRLQRISEPVVAPDGQKIVFTVRETDIAANRGRTDLWLLDLQAHNSEPQRITSHPENDSAPQWSADSRRIYFLSGRGGSSQIWRMPASGGEPEQITRLPVDVDNYRLSPDGTRIVFSAGVFPDCKTLGCTHDRLTAVAALPAKGRVYDRLFVRHWTQWDDGRQAHLFVLKLDNGHVNGEPLAISGWLDADVPSKPFGDNSEYTFSPDGNRIVFSARIKGQSEPWSTNFDLYQVTIDGSAEPVNLTAANPAWDTQPVFSPDGNLLAWRATDRPGFESDRFHIEIRDLKSGAQRALTRDWDRSVDSIAFSRDGKTLYATAEQFGQHPLWAVDVKSGRPALLTGGGEVEDFSVAREQVYFTLATLRSPADLFSVTPRDGELRQLTRLNAEALAQRLLGDAEQFTFAGWNGQTVHAYVVKPAHFDPQGKYPVAFIIHGGPEVAFANQWSYRWNPQVYAGADYAVVFVDFHGSPGYGQAFTDSISGDWGGKPLEDLQKGLAAALAKYTWLNGDKVCALGASYGGYMVDWIAGNWPDAFRCLVSHGGPFDNRMQAYSTEELWFPEWEFGGTPYDVPENYAQQSPVDHVAQWKVPMLITQGELDFRVPYTQSIAAFTAAQRRGVPSRLLMFPDEGHWIMKPANSLQWHKEVLGWLDQWLKAPAATK